jgi:hypothetical protein
MGGGKPADNGCATFDSAFAAIQKLIFERHGCTAQACHGDAKLGGLDLRADAAYASVVDAASMNSKYARVQPGTPNQSFLYLKLKAATEPGSVEIAGSSMPVGTAPLNQNELTALRLWIQQGAPRTGTVKSPAEGDVGTLLDACLPPVDAPTKIKPLEPPAAQEGVQIVLPQYLLKAGSEVEHCTPFVYDVADKVPAQFKDEARNVFFVNASRVRQDPQSHHLVVWNPFRDPRRASAEKGWTCRGGPKDGAACELAKGSLDCDGGVCAGPTVDGQFCGTSENVLETLGGLLSGFGTLVNAQSAQEYVPPLDGVYWEVPLRGVVGFDSHAFNLTTKDTILEARMNFYYAEKRERRIQQLGSVDKIDAAAGQAPFTRQTYCGTHVVPQNYSLAVMTGHTHRRGKRFWVEDPAGQLIYESLVYSDPVYKRYDPWINFSAPSEAARTLKYCATFNNGLTADDKPDLELVTRASRMPARTSCTPVACVAGKVTAACKADADCDSTPGAGDGDCDACPITAGPTTENEMFVLTPWYVLPPK